MNKRHRRPLRQARDISRRISVSRSRSPRVLIRLLVFALCGLTQCSADVLWDELVPEHGKYSRTYMTMDWSDYGRNGKTIADKDPSDYAWQDVVGEQVKRTIIGKSRVVISNLAYRVDWDAAETGKFTTTLFDIRNCDRVEIRDIAIEQLDEFIGADTIRLTECREVYVGNVYICGSGTKQHIRVEGSEYVLIEDVEIEGRDYGTGAKACASGIVILNGAGTDLPWKYDLKFSVVQNCYIHDYTADVPGSDVDAIAYRSAANGILFNCTIENWTGAGIEQAIDPSHRRSDAGYGTGNVFRIERNIIDNAYNTKTPGYAGSSHEIIWCNNVWWNTWHAHSHSRYRVRRVHETFAWDSGRYNLCMKLWSIGGELLVENCLFYVDPALRKSYVYCTSWDTDRSVWLHPDYNVYYMNTPSWMYCDFEDPQYNAATLADWQARGKDENSVLTNTGELFRDAAARDVRLHSASVARGKGTSAYVTASQPGLRVDRDFLGRARSPVAPCAGAFEEPGCIARVQTGADDAEERVDTHAVALHSSDLELVHDTYYPADQLVGLRFQAVAIPGDATIDWAALQMTTDEADSRETTLHIAGQAADDAPAFSAQAGNLSARARTGASVSWSPPGWSTVGEVRTSPDLARVIQEIIERPGWQSGNALALLISGAGRRVAVSCDKDPAAAPALLVSFSVPSLVAPANLAAVPLSPHEVRLAWEDRSDNEESFEIDRRQSGTSFWVCIAALPPDTTRHSDTGLPADTTFYYKVRGYRADRGHSPYSNVADATTPQVPAPAAPAGLDARSVSSAEIRLCWQDRSDNEEGFKVDRRRSGESAWARIATLGPDTTAHSDTGLPLATKFYYKLKAYNAGGNSAYSDPADATTLDGVGAGSAWRYRKGTAEASAPPDAWRKPGFDDTGWAEGPGPFGYSSEPAEGPFGTTFDDMRYNYTCVFLRRTFELDNPDTVAELRLSGVCDDGFILWLNGRELHRHNMQAAPRVFVPYSDRTAPAGAVDPPAPWQLTLTAPNMPELRAGQNVLALQVFNYLLTSSDLKIDCELAAARSTLSAADDADDDGLPDAWEDAHLSDLSDPSDQSDLSYPDNDGLTNLEEYIAGTDPRSEIGNLKFEIRGSGAGVEVVFPTIVASGPGYAGLTRHYQLQRCASPVSGDWTPVPGHEDIAATGALVGYTETVPGAGMCYRARVWLAE